MNEFEIKEQIKILSEYDIFLTVYLQSNPLNWRGIHLYIGNHLDSKKIIFNFLMIDINFGFKHPSKSYDHFTDFSFPTRCKNCNKEIGGTEIELCNECYNNLS